MREYHCVSPAGGAACILLVEDEAPLREELAAGLEDSGFLLRTAGSAEDALAQLAITPDIAVVLTDIRMPGLSGIALAEQIIAARPSSHGVEVVLMTGQASRDEAMRAIRVGAFDFLQKPMRLHTVAAVVGRALARALERRSAALAAEQERIALQALYAAAPIGLGLIGHDLRLAQANPALVDLLGLPEGAEFRVPLGGQAGGARGARGAAAAHPGRRRRTRQQHPARIRGRQGHGHRRAAGAQPAYLPGARGRRLRRRLRRRPRLPRRHGGDHAAAGARSPGQECLCQLHRPGPGDGPHHRRRGGAGDGEGSRAARRRVVAGARPGPAFGDRRATPRPAQGRRTRRPGPPHPGGACLR